MKPKLYALGALLVVLMALLAACGGGSTSTGAGGKVTISLWTHSAGNPLEISTLKQEVAAFNAAHSQQYEVAIQSFPQASYNDSVSAAALSHKLPCLLDLDNPTVANFAWSKYVQPLPITDAQLKQMGLLESAIGRYQGKVYSLGAEGNLVCLDAEKGTVIWSRDFKKDFGVRTPMWGFAAHPLIGIGHRRGRGVGFTHRDRRRRVRPRRVLLRSATAQR